MWWRDRYHRRLTARMAILGALRDGREMSVGGLAGATGLRRHQVEYALENLTEYGKVVGREIPGQTAFDTMYRLDDPHPR